MRREPVLKFSEKRRDAGPEPGAGPHAPWGNTERLSCRRPSYVVLSAVVGGGPSLGHRPTTVEPSVAPAEGDPCKSPSLPRQALAHGPTARQGVRASVRPISVRLPGRYVSGREAVLRLRGSVSSDARPGPTETFALRQMTYVREFTASRGPAPRARRAARPACARSARASRAGCSRACARCAPRSPAGRRSTCSRAPRRRAAGPRARAR
jgi:hypothetical protein